MTASAGARTSSRFDGVLAEHFITFVRQANMLTSSACVLLKRWTMFTARYSVIRTHLAYPVFRVCLSRLVQPVYRTPCIRPRRPERSGVSDCADTDVSRRSRRALLREGQRYKTYEKRTWTGTVARKRTWTGTVKAELNEKSVHGQAPSRPDHDDDVSKRRYSVLSHGGAAQKCGIGRL
jgi:hypothetical protein